MVNLWTSGYHKAMEQVFRITKLLSEGHSLEEIAELTGVDLKEREGREDRQTENYLRGLDEFEKASKQTKFIVKYQVA